MMHHLLPLPRALRTATLLALRLATTCLLGAATSACSDGNKGSLSTGPTMLPGDNCRSCHGAPSSAYPEAPDWSVAGTVFEAVDSDQGAAGVTVEIVDVEGASERLTTNSVGNFYTDTPFKTPFWVSLERDGVRASMPVPVPAGGCNACHRVPSVGQAPGRLYLSADGSFPSVATCDGTQTVSIGTQEYDCSPYLCAGAEGDLGARCLTACDGPLDCAPGFVCSEKRCVSGT